MLDQFISWPFIHQTITAIGLAVLGLFAKYLLTRWVFDRILAAIEHWIKGDPDKHAAYLHFREDHAAPNPRVCEEGQCPTDTR